MPFTIDHHPLSRRAKYGPPGWAIKTSNSRSYR
jgi:hypothetical protein